MALIDLKLIDSLRQEAISGKMQTYTTLYNYPGESSYLSNETFVHLIKADAQAENLSRSLRSLYQMCSDFAKGDFQKYVDQHSECADYDEPYDAMSELIFEFHADPLLALPDKIEQYAELVEMAHKYGHLREAKANIYNQFFGEDGCRFLVSDAEGGVELITESEIPSDQLIRIQSERAIRDIQVEYCLDGYNQFYSECQRLLEQYNESGNAQECATQILKLFK